MIRPAICCSCGHEFDATDEDKVNGRLPCPKCDNNSYWNHVREPDFVPVINIRNKETRQPKHAGVKS